MPVPRTPSRRRALGRVAAGTVAAGALARDAAALMAGLPPDSPEARVDRNVPASPWAGVCAVRIGDGVFSGALVRRRFVLTAAHVVAGRPPGEVSVQFNAAPEPLRIGAQKVLVAPGWRGFTKPFAFHDVALLELDRPVPDALPSYRVLPVPVPPGADLLLVGYGASGQGDQGPSVGADAAVRRVGRNRAERFVAAPDAPDRAAMFLFDFDGPDESSNVFGGPSLGNAVETTAASGDSGAPAFVRIGDRPRLAGVVTFVADLNRPGIALSTFGSSGGGVLLSSVREWLDEVLPVEAR